MGKVGLCIIGVYNEAVWMGAARKGGYLDVANSDAAGKLGLCTKIQLRDSKIKEVKPLMTAVIFVTKKKQNQIYKSTRYKPLLCLPVAVKQIPSENIQTMQAIQVLFCQHSMSDKSNPRISSWENDMPSARHSFVKSFHTGMGEIEFKWLRCYGQRNTRVYFYPFRKSHGKPRTLNFV